MLRKIIGAALGLAMLVGTWLVAQDLIESNKRPVREVPKAVKTVYTQAVINHTIPIIISANGNLVASRKIELYSEVQGIFQETALPFKAGQSYRKGQVLLKLDSREFYTSLLAQRSTLFDLITAMMPDLRFDYPESFKHWQEYLNNFDLEKELAPLPEPISEKEKYFVNGRQVVSTFYSIKNLEERYSKYTISAPFSGVLTESLVNPGTLVRSGQKLGEFVSMEDFELEVNVNEEFINVLEVGEPVGLYDLTGERDWTGTVRRINGRIDQSTQTVQVFIGVRGKGLVEGMYLESNIQARSENGVIEIPRSLLINELEVFVVEDDKLALMAVEPVHFTDKTAIVRGIPDGTDLVIRPVPGAYSGMLVQVAKIPNNPEARP